MVSNQNFKIENAPQIMPLYLGNLKWADICNAFELIYKIVSRLQQHYWHVLLLLPRFLTAHNNVLYR
jgi:hypothetical protein